MHSDLWSRRLHVLLCSGDKDNSRCDHSFLPPGGNGGIFCPAGTITCLQVEQLGENSSLDTLLEDWLLQGEIIVFKKKHIYASRKHFSHESWIQDVFPTLRNFCLCSCKYTFMPIFQVGQIRGPRIHMTQENTGVKKNTRWTKKIPELPKET